MAVSTNTPFPDLVVKYNNHDYFVDYIDGEVFINFESDEFRFKLNHYCYNTLKEKRVQNLGECVVCYDKNVGRPLSCCGNKQFICVECITQLYSKKIHTCPCCREKLIPSILTIIENMPEKVHQDYIKYLGKNRLSPKKIKNLMDNFINYKEYEYFCSIEYDGIIEVEITEDVDNCTHAYNTTNEKIAMLFTKVVKKLGYRKINSVKTNQKVYSSCC